MIKGTFVQTNNAAAYFKNEYSNLSTHKDLVTMAKYDMEKMLHAEFNDEFKFNLGYKGPEDNWEFIKSKSSKKKQ